jgi:hypothetical protein
MGRRAIARKDAAGMKGDYKTNRKTLNTELKEERLKQKVESPSLINQATNRLPFLGASRRRRIEAINSRERVKTEEARQAQETAEQAQARRIAEEMNRNKGDENGPGSLDKPDGDGDKGGTNS